MPTNPWIAIDATTSPSLRARELQRIWYDYLSSGLVDRVRLPIVESWRRSEVAGISPSRSRAPTMLADRREVRERWEAHPLEAAAPMIRRWLGHVAEESEHLVVVSDAEGLLLWLDGDARVRSAAADKMNFVEGALWNEAGAGTNAIGTALAADHPVQIHAAEHFSEIVHGWTCSAAPVHDPEDGKLLGVIDLTGLMTSAHPETLAAVLAAARAVEADLRVRAQVRDAQLRVRYLERMASARR
jgi:transcriptional regulator of acetoin/glycerol metabolism